MTAPHDPSRAPAGVISRSMPGPPFLRHYPAHQLVAWRPEGVLDDALLDEIAEWLFVIEKVALPFKRFVDFTRLENISVRTRHVSDFASKRKAQFAGMETVRTALFCEGWVGFGIARSYESLMEDTSIQARAFRILRGAAEWLDVPANILTLSDDPGPHSGRSAPPG